MNFEEKTINKNIIYQGKILNLRRDDVSLCDGSTSIREIVEHSGGSCVLCEKDDKILFVKQYRYAYQKELLEIPAGKKNPSESAEQTAIRELQEETGLIAKNIKFLYEIYPSPGYTEEVIKIFYVNEFEQGKVSLDDDEFLSCEWIEKDKVKKMIENGEIKDAKTLVALLRVL